MAMGMSYEMFWDGDPSAAVYYRKAEKLKQKHEDERAWLMGLYIQNILLNVYPAFNPFAAKNAKVNPYPNLPYTWEEKRAEQNQLKGFDKMMDYMARFNSQFARKQEEKK